MKTGTKFLVMSLAVAGLFLAFGAILLNASTASASTPSADCIFAPVTNWGTGKVVVQRWNPAPNGVACLTLVWEKQGSVLMAGGVFTAPLTLNGSVLPTKMVAGQLAPQIVQFRRTVVAGEKWEFRPTWLSTGTEIVLGFDYATVATPTSTRVPTSTPTPTATSIPTARVWRIFMPVIFRPYPVLEEVREVNPSSELQMVYFKWVTAGQGQQTCLKINYSGAVHDALIESGWVFGLNLSATLNGASFEIPTFMRPGELATQLSSVQLPAPQNLRVCVTGTGSGNEIGLRIRYPTQ